jgi:hypothetical protein
MKSRESSQAYGLAQQQHTLSSSPGLGSMLEFLSDGYGEGEEEEDRGRVGDWLVQDSSATNQYAAIMLAYCFDSMRELQENSYELVRGAADRALQQKKALVERYHEVYNHSSTR